ncbi:hypothetical protein [Helicobacter canis]|uniref:hypothetical protein n=1 Tax=Helicobacter canis TaxID=29419 RepID=UPI0011C02C93|nr:hypothetical protein [Helicobacter canis]
MRSAFSKETSPSGERYPLFSKKLRFACFALAKSRQSIESTFSLSLRAVLLHRVAIHFQKVDSSVDYF